MSTPTYSLTNTTVTVVIDGEQHTAQRGAANFAKLRDAVLEEDWDAVRANLTTGSSIEKWAKGDFSVTDGSIKYRGAAVPSELNDRIIAAAAAGADPTSLLKFYENLQQNPSWRSVNQLWGFMKHTGIPIDADGYLVAYKGVTVAYRDCHTGKIDNSVGQSPSLPRNQISDDPDVACHFGLHVGAIEYARNFGAKMVVVRVNPRDVVCIPKDSSQQKMRCCEYEVIGKYGGQLPDDLYNVSVPAPRPVSASVAVEAIEAASVPTPDAAEPKKVKAPVEKVAEANASKSRKVPVLTDADVARLNDLNSLDLLAEPYMVLRQYGGKLGLVGVSKMPGGKAVLVPLLIKARTNG